MILSINILLSAIVTFILLFWDFSLLFLLVAHCNEYEVGRLRTAGEYVASQVVKLMIKKGIIVKGANLLMVGITFKENCPDDT